MRAAAFALLLAAPAAAQSIHVEELPGEPFARIVVRNVCGDASGRHVVETSRGPVTLFYEENNNGCGLAPDTVDVIDLPPEVAAQPPSLALTEIEFAPSEPGVILLYTYRGL